MRKVSELLRETREEKGLDLKEVSSSTKIKEEYLEKIEQGNFTSLPSENYALGFVKNYAKYLEIPLSTVVPLFRREYDARRSVSIIPEFRKTQSKFRRPFIFSPLGFVMAAAVLLVGAYIFFQYSSLIFAPKLDIESPNNGDVINSNVVEVRGKTDPYATVFIDKDEIYVGIDGTFKKSVYEFSGNATITVIARNRFGKESKEIINLKVE